jgi:hypothetical protein
MRRAFPAYAEELGLANRACLVAPTYVSDKSKALSPYGVDGASDHLRLATLLGEEELQGRLCASANEAKHTGTTRLPWRCCTGVYEQGMYLDVWIDISILMDGSQVSSGNHIHLRSRSGRACLFQAVQMIKQAGAGRYAAKPL